MDEALLATQGFAVDSGHGEGSERWCRGPDTFLGIARIWTLFGPYFAFIGRRAQGWRHLRRRERRAHAATQAKCNRSTTPAPGRVRPFWIRRD